MDQAGTDALMLSLDDTPNKSRLGANAILGVSCAVARAATEAEGMPFFKRLGGPSANLLPVPMFNIPPSNAPT